MNWLILKLSRKLLGQGPGIIRVRKGSDGAPAERYWRDRLKDAETDGCCEIVKPEKAKPSSKQKDVADD